MGLMFRLEYAQLPIFAGLDGDQISRLAPFFYECELEKDLVIFEQNQAAEYLYVLLKGEVAVRYKPYDGPLLTVARIEPGGVFGWSAALGRDVYTSGAIALQESLAYRLRGDSLPEICACYPETGKIWLERLASVIAERLRSTHSQVLEILSKGKDATNFRD
jgi:CRP/FNR family transcriptional regulator, cyclic AMP receptor protein